MPQPTDEAKRIGREIALRNIPAYGSEYPLSPHSRVILVDNLANEIARALTDYVNKVEEVANAWRNGP